MTNTNEVWVVFGVPEAQSLENRKEKRGVYYSALMKFLVC